MRERRGVMRKRVNLIIDKIDFRIEIVDERSIRRNRVKTRKELSMVIKNILLITKNKSLLLLNSRKITRKQSILILTNSINRSSNDLNITSNGRNNRIQVAREGRKMRNR